MKHFTLLASLFILTGCSYFVQIATFESDNITLQNDDRFIYNDDIVSIEYKINNDGSIFDFRVINNTEQEIVIDITKSCFVYNGNVYDYAGRSTTIATHSFDFSLNSYFIGNSQISSTGSATGTSIAETKTIPNQMIIPAGCHRTFGSFSIDRRIYYNDAILNGIQNNNTVARMFTKENTPIRIINIITILYNGEERKVINEMFLKYINVYPLSKAPGVTNYNEEVLIYNNQMYIKYDANAVFWLDTNNLDESRTLKITTE